MREWVRRPGTPPAGDVEAARDEANCARLGERVRARVWDPIERVVGSSRECFIVPEGEITELPWLALPDSGRHYLAESDRLIHVIDAERDLLPAPGAAKGAGMLAVGAPDFDLGAGPANVLASVQPQAVSAPLMLASRARQGTCGGTGSLALPPLPASLAEVEGIAWSWPPASGAPLVLTGTGADEASVKREAPGRAVIHIATHGIVVEDTCAAAVAGSRGIGGVARLSAANRHGSG